MKKLKSLLKILIPLGIGVFFIYFTYRITTQNEREIILKYIKSADYRFVLLSIIFGILSHLSRAYRWKFLLVPIGYNPSFINSTLAVLIGYIANLGIPRSGEILRATMMTSYEKIPFEKGFGTIISERIIDLVILFGFVLMSLTMQYDLIWDILIEKKGSNSTLLFAIVFLIIIILLFRFLFKKIKFGTIIKIQKFIEGLKEGILSFKSMPKKRNFIFHTIFIWSMYLAMFYVIKWSIPETVNLGINALLPAFVIGGLSISATNGGIGVYPLSVALVFSAFGISNESGLAFGWIIWSSQTLMIIFFGSLSFFMLPLVNRKKQI